MKKANGRRKVAITPVDSIAIIPKSELCILGETSENPRVSSIRDSAGTTAVRFGLAQQAGGSGRDTQGPNKEDTHNAELLRDACVALERTNVATDTNDFGHLKVTDWMNARYCPRDHSRF